MLGGFFIFIRNVLSHTTAPLLAQTGQKWDCTWLVKLQLQSGLEWFYLSRSHMLCMAGWLRRGSSTSDVKRSTSSRQSIGFSDGCRNHWKEGHVWRHSNEENKLFLGKRQLYLSPFPPLLFKIALCPIHTDFCLAIIPWVTVSCYR